MRATYDADYIETRSIPEPNSGCWLWEGNISPRGYGRVYLSPTSSRKAAEDGAHRISYRIYCGAIPDGMQIRHQCDNRACVNPSHLLVGTITDNMADRDRRQRTCRGDRHYRAKLNADSVRAIRAQLSNGKTVREVAKSFGVTDGCIHFIRVGRTWAHVA